MSEDTPSWPNLLAALLRREDLTAEQARWAMRETMSGEASPVQLAGFLVALRAKGETATELRGLADVMLEHANRIDVPGPAVDIVGTGGDRLHSVNISTMASVVVAATGLRVVKHGNRAASSSSGAADVLEALGVDLGLSPADVAEVATEAGITFCFAQAFHPSMRHAAAARGGLGVGTAFNLLGPLTNPAQPAYAAVGVADLRFAPLLAGVFAQRGRSSAVFRGEEGLDELSVGGPSRVWWVRGGTVSEHLVSPGQVSVGEHAIEELRGGDPAFNADVARRVFAGERGAPRDAVALNAGMALAVAAGTAGHETSEVVGALEAGVRRAEQALDDGSAQRLLEAWVAATRARSSAR